MQSNLSLLRPPAIWIIALLLFLAMACQTTEKAITLDEARKISLEFQNRTFTPPPRTISDLDRELRVYTGGAECDAEPMKMLSRQEVIDHLHGGWVLHHGAMV